MDEGIYETRGDETGGGDREFWSWLGFWGGFFGLAVLGIWGAFFASANARPGDYQCGLSVALCAAALAFLRLRAHLDGNPPAWSAFLLVGRMANLLVVLPLFSLLGLAGLFLANAWEAGSLHAAGIGLFAASGLFVFLNLKRAFDRHDAGLG
jgi:hypothetical protein